MKFNKWTLGLAAMGVVSLASAVKAEEKASEVMTALSSTTLSGYVDTSAQWNFKSGNANNPPYAFGGAGKADGFNLNVVKLTLEKPVEPADGWSAGYKVDLIFGPDANTLATQSSGTAADFAVKQAYVALRAPVGNGLDFKIGVWDTMIGYEVFESGNNPNFTRSYGYSIEPTTHTGVHVGYAFTEWLSAAVCMANTFGPTINGRADSESYKTYMGSVTLTAPQGWGVLAGSTLSAGVINGFNSFYGDNQTSWYLGAVVNTPVTGLKVGAAFDYLDVHNASSVTPGADGEVWTVAGYGSYQATEKLSLHARVEYLDDRAYFFYPPITNPTPPPALLAPGLTEAQIFAVTATVQYDLWKNVMSRLEFRWDRSVGGDDLFGGSTSRAPNGKDAFMLAANIIYKF